MNCRQCRRSRRRQRLRLRRLRLRLHWHWHGHGHWRRHCTTVATRRPVPAALRQRSRRCCTRADPVNLRPRFGASVRERPCECCSVSLCILHVILCVCRRGRRSSSRSECAAEPRVRTYGMKRRPRLRGRRETFADVMPMPSRRKYNKLARRRTAQRVPHRVQRRTGAFPRRSRHR